MAGSSVQRSAERARELLRHDREGDALAQQLCAHEVQADVAVAELEPRLPAKRGHGVERVPALVGAAPAALLVGEAAQGVEHAVEIRRDMEAEHLDVVPHVAYDGDVVCIDDSRNATEEPCSADTAREDGRLHAAFPAGSWRPSRTVQRGEDAERPGPEPLPQPLEVGDRVHVIHEIRRVHQPRRRERGEPLGTPGPVERDEDPRRGQPERVRRPVRRPGEREAAVGDGAREREQVTRGDAREVGVDDEQRSGAAGCERGDLETRAHRRSLPAARIVDHGRCGCRSPRCVLIRGGDDERRSDGRARGHDVAQHRGRECRSGCARELAEPALALRPAEGNH